MLVSLCLASVIYFSRTQNLDRGGCSLGVHAELQWWQSAQPQTLIIKRERRLRVCSVSKMAVCEVCGVNSIGTGNRKYRSSEWKGSREVKDWKTQILLERHEWGRSDWEKAREIARPDHRGFVGQGKEFELYSKCRGKSVQDLSRSTIRSYLCCRKSFALTL